MYAIRSYYDVMGTQNVADACVEFGIRVMVPDKEYPEGNPHTWYTKDGYNTPKHREALLKETMELNATMLHTLKPGEHGLEEGGINVHQANTSYNFV